MNRVWWLISGVLLAVFLYFVVDRIVFLIRSEHTVAEVVRISASNARCGSRRNKRPCTKFSAEVRFTVAATAYTEWVSAGSVRGYGMSTKYAHYQVGSPVMMLVNPRDPEEAYRDAFWDIWSTPIMTLVFQIATLIGGIRAANVREHDEGPYSPSGRQLT